MFKKLIPLAVLPFLALAQPAKADPLFWWQDVNPNLPGSTVSPYVDQGPYGPDDRFDEREYRLYQREMRRRYGYEADYPPEDYPYAPPVYRAQPAPAVPYTAPAYQPPTYATPVVPKPKVVSIAPKAKAVSTTGQNTQTAAAPAKKPAGDVSCEKGAAIVSGFGFDKVKSKTCASGTLAYNAERSGQPFEVTVNPKTGELIAVKKLPAPSAAAPEAASTVTRTEL